MPEIRGKVWKFGDHISGDNGIIDFEIVRSGFGKEPDEAALRAMCFQRLRPEFAANVRDGDIVVGGHNFAHHNHIEVSAALKASGIAAVIADSCDSGFIRRALNFGLPVISCRGVTAFVEDNEVLTVDPAEGVIARRDGKRLTFPPFSTRMLDIWRAGGIVPLLREELKREASDADHR
jgi:3-isopropylmalate/(R)-2-methylmalate dehydratase small subunit